MRPIGLELDAMRAVFALTILSIASFAFLVGCQGMQPRIATPKVIAGFSSPECVVSDSGGKYFYVSNMGEKLEASAKDSDGFISRLSSRGEIVDKRYLPRTGFLNSPKGMAIIGETIFVTDVDRVVGFDLTTREQTLELDFSSEGTTFLNDLAVVDDKTLVVSATDIGKIYRISLDEEQRFSLLAGNIIGANGFYFNPRTEELFVVSFGDGYNFDGGLGVISFRNDEYEYRSLTGKIGGLDGVALLDDSRVIVSDWVAFDKTGVMRVYDLKTKELSVIDLSEEVDGPADFFYDERNGNLWLPKMKEGKVLVEEIR